MSLPARRLVLTVVAAGACAIGARGAAGAAEPGETMAKEGGAQMSPIYALEVLGGQNFYTGQTAILSGDFKGLAAPAVKLNGNWSLLPILQTDFTGTRQVLDLVGGGSLFQSEWNNQASLKAIYTPDNSLWRLKPYASFKYEFLRAAPDERLGRGLYDYYQWEAGADAEYVYHDPFAINFGVDYYQVHFPNYKSLESQAATSAGGQSLARELVGDYVLDTQNVLASASVNGRLGGPVIVEATAAGLYQNFPNQHLVDASGSLESPLRQDILTIYGAGLRLPQQWQENVKSLGFLNLGYTYDSSSQNSFDAAETRYLPHFYNYGELKVNPGVQLFLGPEKRPVEWDLSGTFWWRRYPHRNIQDPTGLYLNDALWTDSWMAQTTLRYPMAEHFKLVFNVQYGQEISNQQYTALYQYSYRTATYMFGFSYDY